jgi:hypothetical protein
MINKERPKYDPIIEQLNDSARDLAAERQRELHLDKTIEHEAQSVEGRTEGLRTHGRRIAPDKTKYIGSFCIHVYEERGAIAKQNQLLSLSTGTDIIGQALAKQSIETLMLHIMTQYGIAPKATLDKKKAQMQTVKDNL